MYHYLFFIVWLQIKDKTEFTGPESYVYECINVREARAFRRRNVALSVAKLYRLVSALASDLTRRNVRRQRHFADSDIVSIAGPIRSNVDGKMAHT